MPNILMPWPDEVILALDVPNKRGLIEVAASLLASRHGVSDAVVFRALWRREQAGSTGLGHGVAIPHARIAGLGAALTLFIRTRAAIDFAAPDRQPASCFFVILVPESGDHQHHLQLLASIANMVSDARFCEDLRKTTTVVETRSLLQSARRKYGEGPV